MHHQGRAIVTGAAGFVGSSVAARLLDLGMEVVGVDCLTDYYDGRIKEANLARLTGRPGFELQRRPILELDWPALLKGVGTVYHQAAQAGVRASWGKSFECYTEWNVLSTQRILDAMRETGARMVYASSSSVYGETARLPMREDHMPQPMSPYGVTKLAAEHLCVLYWRNFQVPTVSLRYFTVYGPRQRPDMAFHKWIKATVASAPMPLYGDGEQTRDFTYIDDIVEANLLAAEKGKPGGVYNIGGGSRVTVNQVLATLEKIAGKPVPLDRQDRQHGDVTHTYADTTLARTELGFVPKIALEEGLGREFAWFVENRDLLLAR